MHPEAYSFCASLAEKTNTPIFDDDGSFIYTQVPERGLDIGGANINGTARSLWPQTKWTVLDKEDGDDVDIVTDATCWNPIESNNAPFDLVLCTNVLEHEEHWPAIVHTCVKALGIGGHLVLTAAGKDRSLEENGSLFPFVGAEAISPNELLSFLLGETADGLMVRTFTFNPHNGDIYFYGIRKW